MSVVNKAVVNKYDTLTAFRNKGESHYNNIILKCILFHRIPLLTTP